MDNDEKVRENRARRVLSRRGFVLYKSRRRDKNAPDYGGYMICEDYSNIVVSGCTNFAYSDSLVDVEAFILREK